MFLLDTDHLVILQRASGPAFAQLTARMALHRPDDFSLSIVSIHEQMLGWNAYIGRAIHQTGIVRGYNKLYELLEDFSGRGFFRLACVAI
jgi:tRNA(fMet)-specific endonuclease VapC